MTIIRFCRVGISSRNSPQNRSSDNKQIIGGERLRSHHQQDQKLESIVASNSMFYRSHVVNFMSRSSDVIPAVTAGSEEGEQFQVLPATAPRSVC